MLTDTYHHLRPVIFPHTRAAKMTDQDLDQLMKAISVSSPPCDEVTDSDSNYSAVGDTTNLDLKNGECPIQESVC